MCSECLPPAASNIILFLFRKNLRWAHHVIHFVYLVRDRLLLFGRDAICICFDHIVDKVSLDFLSVVAATDEVLSLRVPAVGHGALGCVAAQAARILLQAARVSPHIIGLYVEDGTVFLFCTTEMLSRVLCVMKKSILRDI